MDLIFLLAQQTPDFSNVPPPTEAAQSWWPMVTTAISLIVAAIAALFTAWQKIREKKLENAANTTQERLNLEIEEIKHQFESRKQLHEQLTQQIQNLLDEGRALRKELQESRSASIAKDGVIAEMKGEVAALKAKVAFLEGKLANALAANESCERDLADEKENQKEPPPDDAPPV